MINLSTVEQAEPHQIPQTEDQYSQRYQTKKRGISEQSRTVGTVVKPKTMPRTVYSVDYALPAVGIFFGNGF
jgi:hypothetical protein